MNEWLYMQQLLTGRADGWLAGFLVAGLFAVLIYQPERIQRMGLFKLACWLAALAIAVPAALGVLLSAAMVGTTVSYGSMGGTSGPAMLLTMFSGALGPGMLGASVLCGLFALLPSARPLGPARHPLE